MSIPVPLAARFAKPITCAVASSRQLACDPSSGLEPARSVPHQRSFEAAPWVALDGLVAKTAIRCRNHPGGRTPSRSWPARCAVASPLARRWSRVAEGRACSSPIAPRNSRLRRFEGRENGGRRLWKGAAILPSARKEKNLLNGMKHADTGRPKALA